MLAVDVRVVFMDALVLMENRLRAPDIENEKYTKDYYSLDGFMVFSMMRYMIN